MTKWLIVQTGIFDCKSPHLLEVFATPASRLKIGSLRCWLIYPAEDMGHSVSGLG